MRMALLLAVLLVPSPLEIAVLPQLPASDVTDADVERLFAGVDQARGYNDLVTTLTRHERALVSQRLLDSMADAANRPQGSPQPSAPARGATDPALVGHWRTTRIVFESPRDDHLVLRVDGTAERWSVTASSAGPKTVGQWAVTGSVLSLTWTGGAQTSQAFTMYKSQLVLPNVPNRRVFWDRLDR
jgi:hypothetical protein